MKIDTARDDQEIQQIQHYRQKEKLLMEREGKIIENATIPKRKDTYLKTAGLREEEGKGKDQERERDQGGRRQIRLKKSMPASMKHHTCPEICQNPSKSQTDKLT